MYDFHTHSEFSNDSTSTMLAMAQAAKRSGLKGICFTDHVDFDYGDSHIDYDFSYEDYVKELNRIRPLLSEDFELFCGAELGLQPHVATQNEAFLRKGPFDFVIGSIHIVGMKDMYDGSYLEGKTHNEVIINYFDDMLQCLDNFKDFDVVGHFDGIRRYLEGREESFSFDTYKEFINNALSRLVASNKGIEVNTSGLRYGLSSFHPLPDILKLYRRLGGEIVTLGSDSHTPETLGYDFKNVLSVLSDIGFKYYTIFRDRKPVFIKI